MQCKDIPDLPVLRFLASLPEDGKWATWSANDDGSPRYPNSVQHAMPPGIPPKLAWAKMNVLIRRGLVDGCPCGCRGDYELTAKGREALANSEAAGLVALPPSPY